MRAHLPAPDHGGMDPAPAPYLIRINGHLGATMLSAFPALAPQHHGAHTVLTGLLDQSALYGVLAEIEALALDLLELRKLIPDRESPGSGTTAHRDGHCHRARPFATRRSAPITTAPVRDLLADRHVRLRRPAGHESGFGGGRMCI
jgi:hypothetical protein